jgi:hypothetical protein
VANEVVSLSSKLRETAELKIEHGRELMAEGHEMLGRVAVIYGDEQTFGRQLNFDFDETFNPEIARPGGW